MLLALIRGLWAISVVACFVYVACWVPAYSRAARSHTLACDEHRDAIQRADVARGTGQLNSAYGDTRVAFEKTVEAFDRTWEPFNNIMGGAFAGLILGMLGRLVL